MVGGVQFPITIPLFPARASIEWSGEGVIEDVDRVWDGVRELRCAVLPLELDGVGGVVGIGDVGGEVGNYYGSIGTS